MLNFNTTSKIHICTKPTDMRKSFDGLGIIVAEQLQANVLSGDLFVFFNKNKTMVKVLNWDKTGYAIYYKKLNQGSFHLPFFDSEKNHSQEFDIEELLLILKGINLENSKQFKRFGLHKIR